MTTQADSPKPSKHAQPTARPTPEAAVAAAEPTSLRDLWEAYGRSAVAAMLFVVVLYGAYAGWQWTRHRTRAEASRALSRAERPEELDQIVRRYGSTPVAPIALLRLTALRYREGNWALAESLYAEFVRRYPDHPMAPGAEYGRFRTWENLGRSQEALEAYRDFERRYPGHFLLPQVTLGRARCLEKLGRFEEARQAYEEVLLLEPPETLRAEVDVALARLERRKSHSDLPISLGP